MSSPQRASCRCRSSYRRSSTASTSTPSSSSGAPLTILSLAPATKLTMVNQAQFKSTSDTATTISSSRKKKSDPPAILKNEGKAKPTITSIKTLVPPLTSGVKSLKFQSPPRGKAMPLISQKSAPGKYVIVRTGGQQVRYSIKPGGAQQKIVMPAGKTVASRQIVQQGGKVVILTSLESGQTKMLPLNIAKSMTGQGIAKTIIAPTGDAALATTSKLAQGQKVINTQRKISPKGVLTSIMSTKCSSLSMLPQTMLTKGGMYTPISTAQLAGNTLIGGKGLVTKTSTIPTALNPRVLTTLKCAVVAPHTLTAKTIMNAPGLVATKGTTVFTPITGQKMADKNVDVQEGAMFGGFRTREELDIPFQLNRTSISPEVGIEEDCAKVWMETTIPKLYSIQSLKRGLKLELNPSKDWTETIMPRRPCNKKAKRPRAIGPIRGEKT